MSIYTLCLPITLFGTDEENRTLKHLILNQTALPICVHRHNILVPTGGVEPQTPTSKDGRFANLRIWSL